MQKHFKCVKIGNSVGVSRAAAVNEYCLFSQFCLFSLNVLQSEQGIFAHFCTVFDRIFVQQRAVRSVLSRHLIINLFGVINYAVCLFRL